ncbi:MAG: ankyrin repeat domain-containing protein [Vicinamibacterales bacterium]
MGQAFFDAIKAGRLDEVKSLAGADPLLLRARDSNGSSAILFAIYNGRKDVAEVLIAPGAPLDLFEASALNRVERIEEILRAEPQRVSEYAPDGFTPVALAAFFGHADVVRTLIAAGADVRAPARNAFKVQALHAAVAGRNLEIVMAVLEAGADPNAQQQAGFRPIDEAGSHANRALAELLIAHGADPRLRADSGKNAIELAREKGHTEFATWLEQSPSP